RGRQPGGGAGAGRAVPLGGDRLHRSATGARRGGGAAAGGRAPGARAGLTAIQRPPFPSRGGIAAAMRLRPCDLAAYSARSAPDSRRAGVLACPGAATFTPTLTVTQGATTDTGCAIAASSTRWRS